VVDACGHGNELFCSIRDGEFLGQFSDSDFLVGLCYIIIIKRHMLAQSAHMAPWSEHVMLVKLYTCEWDPNRAPSVCSLGVTHSGTFILVFHHSNT
jgi:hypothetical protein